MAQKKGWNAKGGNSSGAVAHGAIGLVPFGNLYEGYKAGKGITGSKAAGVGVAAATSLTYPVGGVVAGGIHGWHTHPGAPPRNLKSSNSGHHAQFHGAKNMSGAHHF